MDDRGASGGATAYFLGEIVVWVALCGIGTLGIFVFRRWPTVTTILLIVVAAIVAVLAFFASRHLHHGPRRWWNVVGDVFIASFTVASTLFLITSVCSCP